MAIGDRIKELRVSKGLNQKDLADATGITRSTISAYENGRMVPPASAVTVLMKALGVDANCLLQDEVLEAKIREQTPAPELADEEVRMIRRYRSLGEDDRQDLRLMVEKFPDLDDFGKDLVRTVLLKEARRCEIMSDADENERLIAEFRRLLDLEKGGSEGSPGSKLG